MWFGLVVSGWVSLHPEALIAYVVMWRKSIEFINIRTISYMLRGWSKILKVTKSSKHHLLFRMSLFWQLISCNDTLWLYIKAFTCCELTWTCCGSVHSGPWRLTKMLKRKNNDIAFSSFNFFFFFATLKSSVTATANPCSALTGSEGYTAGLQYVCVCV